MYLFAKKWIQADTESLFIYLLFDSISDMSNHRQLPPPALIITIILHLTCSSSGALID